MHIVKILGGLGNQMFQYAFACELELRSKRQVQLDLSSYGTYGLHNGYELQRVFGINAQSADVRDVDRLSTRPSNIIKRFIRKYYTKKTHFIDRYFGFYEKVFDEKDDTYFDGYWQSEKYFSSVEERVRADFRFQLPLDALSETLLSSLPRPSLAVHVRRGDYLKSVNQFVCKEDYYRRALDEALSLGDIASVVFLSDDPHWCKEHLQCDGLQTYYPDWNKGSDSWRDMAIMAACDHAIIANSSFSWWGAWLNANAGKRIYAPAIWNRRQIESNDRYYSFKFDDIVPAKWIRIRNDV